MTYAITCDISIPRLPSKFPNTGHVMPVFQDNLVGMGPMCDADYTVTFTNNAVTVYIPTENPIITGWREVDGPRLWRMSLLTNTEDVPPLSSTPDVQETHLQDFSSYYLPSVEALVQYLHAAASFPVRDTLLKDIKSGNFASLPGLTYQNAAKYHPISDICFIHAKVSA